MLTLIQAFSKKKTDDRKEWLTNFMEDRRQRRMHGLPEVCMEEAFICMLLSQNPANSAIFDLGEMEKT